MARGDAREVAKSAGSEGKQLGGVFAARHLVDEREGKQVRKVADGGENLVVLLRAHLAGARAAGGPGPIDSFHRLLGILGKRGDDDPLAAEQLGARRRRAALLGARHRTRRHALGDFFLERLARSLYHVALGAPRVGNDRAGLQRRIDALKYLRALPDRGGNPNEVRVLDGTRGIAFDGIDGAALERKLHVGRITPRTHNVPAGLGLLQRERERAADQADTDHRDFLKKHYSLRLAASAARNFSFSAAVPTATRTGSGSP